jgi:hypothetical protein
MSAQRAAARIKNLFTGFPPDDFIEAAIVRIAFYRHKMSADPDCSSLGLNGS